MLPLHAWMLMGLAGSGFSEQIDSSRRKGRKEKKGESHVETPTAADGASSDASGETDSDGAGISRRTRTGTRLRKRVQS
jgi:hypothetical protein